MRGAWTEEGLRELTAAELRIAFNANRPALSMRAHMLLGQMELRLERLEKCEAALRYVEAWKFPDTDLTWNDGSKISWGAAYGSNGERDHMREIARAALEE